ncbi:MAG: DNA polymerase III subunit delta [Actinomycetota bacterium]|nr:DNA polymerase III subunit delta [Actinomycetota bacterium]
MAESPALKPVYLLTGSDRPKIETALARLRRHFQAEATELVSAQELAGSEVAALCNAGSLFGDARLVVVEGVDGRRNTEGRLANAWKVADVKAVEEYLASPAPATVLALVAEELKKDAALTKACAKTGEILDFNVAKRSLNAWVAERFKQAGARAEPEACAALILLVGEDMHQLANEIDKLAVWAGNEPIGEREVEALVAAVAETPTFALTDAWAQRDVGRTLAASETIFEREAQPRRNIAPRLAGALGNHLSFMRRCQQLAADGVRAREAATTLKRHPFYVEKVFAQAANFSEDELRTAVVRLAALDHALKGGSKLSPDLELQRALIDLSAAD